MKGCIIGMLLLLVGVVCVQAQSNLDLAEEADLAGKHPVFYSEYKLRSAVETFNKELLALKRDFTQHAQSTYLAMKSDRTVGMARAKEQAVPPMSVLTNILIAEQFANILIKKHVIERRLLAGLKQAYVKFLPLRTLKRLIELYPNEFGWLKDQNQVDLRPAFPDAKENQYVLLYTIIEQRARMRAADDIATQTAEHMRYVLNALHHIIVQRQAANSGASYEQVSGVTKFANKIIKFYQTEVIEAQKKLHDAYDGALRRTKNMASKIGGEKEFMNYIDRVIDAEVLDIDLSADASDLALPPTISEDMINNVARKWIPNAVLDSLNDGTRVLLDNKRAVKPLVSCAPEVLDAELAKLCKKTSSMINKSMTIFY